MSRLVSAAFILFIISTSSVVVADDSAFLREDFRSLDNWKSLYFPKIEIHTKYSSKTEGKFALS